MQERVFYDNKTRSGNKLVDRAMARRLLMESFQQNRIEEMYKLG